jgi:hypothetical protein
MKCLPPWVGERLFNYEVSFCAQQNEKKSTPSSFPSFAFTTKLSQNAIQAAT